MSNGTLYLIWRSPNTRAQYRLGELSFDGTSYQFRYDQEGLERARAGGFRLKGSPIYPTFPEISRIYESRELPHVIAHRLPDRSRPDYRELLAKKGLSPNAAPFEILRRTRGRLATDQLFFEEAPIRTRQGAEIFHCYIAGWKYHSGESLLNQLQIGHRVDLSPERSNQFDPSAIAVLTQSGEKLGYLPAFHSERVDRAFPEGRRVEARITEINFPPAPPDERVRIEVKMEVSSRQGLSDEEVKTRAITKLKSNRLPRSFPNAVQSTDLEGREPIVIGSGLGQVCSVCDLVASDPQEIVTEFRYASGQRFIFHNRCFEIWNELRHVPVRHLLQSNGGDSGQA